ncbi:MAG: hypothetical protein KGI68_00860 [Alphaproteobacteria bacterium]|nr:hypothetical protein [Alphaproteobacteria bacterium]MDE1985991.1 hypothetical protein [Alphaproteobacteria bacterium]MDE2163865.1 hypothetical protein [Alphaproteobacteria bacterium]MDE2500370.1 hypothetical protein [Alphaproteobacteria bacterium]
MRAWIKRTIIRGIASGIGLVFLSFLSCVYFMYSRHGISGLKRVLELRPSDLSFGLMIFTMVSAFGFAIVPLYELCKWFDATVRAWWVTEAKLN